MDSKEESETQVTLCGGRRCLDQTSREKIAPNWIEIFRIEASRKDQCDSVQDNDAELILQVSKWSFRLSRFKLVSWPLPILPAGVFLD